VVECVGWQIVELLDIAHVVPDAGIFFALPCLRGIDSWQISDETCTREMDQICRSTWGVQCPGLQTADNGIGAAGVITVAGMKYNIGFCGGSSNDIKRVKRSSDDGDFGVGG